MEINFPVRNVLQRLGSQTHEIFNGKHNFLRKISTILRQRTVQLTNQSEFWHRPNTVK